MSLSAEIEDLGARNALALLCEVSRHYQPDTHPNIQQLKRIISRHDKECAASAGSYMLQAKPEVKDWYAYLFSVAKNRMQEKSQLQEILEAL